MVTFSEFLAYTSFVALHKVLLFPAYKSTDFEVHRNWLAITHSLPLTDWYYADQSQWTLDYPPFFAYMEYLFSVCATVVDQKIVDVFNLEYDAKTVVYFQRMTVILSELVLGFAAFKWSGYLNKMSYNQKLHMLLLFITNCGLLIVDHIHFQYNGFLFGLLLLSMYYIATGNEVIGSLYFAALLNFKHIFIYVAPAFGIYLLRYYCFHNKRFDVVRFIKLGLAVVFVFILSFGPFIHHLPQIFSRLFPFKRGLTHSYWAPNVWALYNFTDKIVSVIGMKFSLISSQVNSNCFSKGLVKVCDHLVLPSIQPIHTFALTFLSMSPCLFNLFSKPCASKLANVNRFFRAVQLCSLCSFMFGWHVHEKAIIMTIIPSTILAFFGSHNDKQLFFVLQYVGHYSLFPLLYEPFGKMLRFIIWLMYSLLSYMIIPTKAVADKDEKSHLHKTKTLLLRLYLLMLPLNELFFSLVYSWTRFSNSHPFLPLMLTSVLCSVGLLACLVCSYKLFFQEGYHCELKTLKNNKQL